MATVFKGKTEVSPWRRVWYPIVFSEDLKKDEPYGIQILGDPLVIFRDKKGDPACLADRCPHRSAPLSLGTVRQGNIECKYHGWQFSTGGECTRIPSLSEDKPVGKSFCAFNYPVVERYNLIWVWMGPSELVDERLIPDHLFKEVRDRTNFTYNYGIRDLEIDHGLMIENLLDPSHLPFTHEGTLSKRSEATVADFNLIWDNLNTPFPPLGSPTLFEEELPPRMTGEEVTTKEWLKVETEECDHRARGFRSVQGRYLQPLRPEKTNQYFTFESPATTRLDLYLSKPKQTNHHNRRRLTQLHFNIPVTPTKMRFVFIFLRNFGLSLNSIPGFNRLFLWQSDTIINQDVEMLGGQQVYLLNGAKAWNTAVPADKLGVKYRRYREKEEKKKDFWFNGFQAQQSGGVADIEDLVPSDNKTKTVKSSEIKDEGTSSSSSPTTTSSSSTESQHLFRWTMTTAGSKFQTRTHIELFDPKLVVTFKKSMIFLLLALALHYLWPSFVSLIFDS